MNVLRLSRVQVCACTGAGIDSPASATATIDALSIRTPFLYEGVMYLIPGLPPSRRRFGAQGSPGPQVSMPRLVESASRLERPFRYTRRPHRPPCATIPSRLPND